jgi:predicted porin
MKKSLLALATLTAFAGAASAQSSVTLFGLVDVALTSQTNGSAGTIKSLSTDGINSSRIGLRGIEDLGGSLRAGFWLEGGFGADTGCGNGSLGSPTGTSCSGQTWQRRSTVSLIGNFGEVRLGRDYTPTFNNIAAFDPFGYNGVAQVGNLRSTLGSGAGTAVRANNSVAYFLPSTIGGLYGQVQIAAGEGTPGNKNLSGRLGYAAGPLNVGFAFAKNEKPTGAGEDYKQMNFGGAYDFGVAKLSAAYEKNDYGDLSQKITLLAVQAPLGQGVFKASYVRSSGSNDNYTANQFGVGYVYDLSKRTALYTQYGRVSNGGDTTTGGRFTAFGAGLTSGFLKSETSSAYQFGVRHSF